MRRVPLTVVEQLYRRFEPVATRRMGAAVALVGPVGVGKTTAARALLARLTCASASLRAADSWPSWAAAVPRHRRTAPWAGRALERLQAGDVLAPADVAGALLAAWTVAAPFVLLVDGLDEADEGRLEVVDALARALPRVKGAGLVATARGRPTEGFETFRVEPLDDGPAAALLEDALGAPLPDGASGYLRGRAQGNPLMLLEHLRLVRELGALWHDGRRWRWREPDGDDLPPTVKALIDRQLRALDPESGRALAARAYLPAEAPDDLWRSLAAPDVVDVDASLRELVRRGVLVSTATAGQGGLPRHDVAHAGLRDVARRRLGPTDRRRLAGRLAELLAGRPREAARFVVDADLAPDVALDLLVRGADEADSAGCPVEAARLRARAADVASGAGRGSLALAAARGLHGHDPSEAVRMAGVAVEAGAGAAAVHVLAGELMSAGRRDDATEVLELLPAEERTGAAGARHRITVHGSGGGDPRVVVQAWSEHPELRVDPDARLVYAVAFSMVLLGRHEDARALASDALARGLDGAPLERCRLLHVLGLSLGEVGEHDAAEAALDEAVELARRADLGAWLAAALHNRAILHEERGRDREMIADVEEALAVYGAVGDALRSASTQTKLARHLVEAGAFERAEELLLEARATLLPRGPSPFLVTCESVLSFLYREWRSAHGGALALEHAAAAREAAHAVGLPAKELQALAASAWAEAAFGSPERGLELADELVGRARTTSDPEMLVESLLPLGVALVAVGRRGDAVAALLEAERVALDLPRPVLAQLVRLELARVRYDAAGIDVCRSWFAERGLHGYAARAARSVTGGAPAHSPVSAPVDAGAGETARARLDVLGPMRVHAGGTGAFVKGDKRRTLLACLLEARLARREGVERGDLLELLYPGIDERQAATALKQLVYQLRRVLGPGGIVLAGDAYALAAVESDAEAFLASGDTSWWRGPAFAGVAVGSPADRARDLLHQRLVVAIRARLADDAVEAARLGRILAEAEPYDTAALTLVLHALRAEGDDKAVGDYLAVARRRLAEVGSSLPDAWPTARIPDITRASPGRS